MNQVYLRVPQLFAGFNGYERTVTGFRTLAEDLGKSEQFFLTEKEPPLLYGHLLYKVGEDGESLTLLRTKGVEDAE